MKRACGLQLAIYLAIAGVAGVFVYRRFPLKQPAIIAGVVGGFFVWLGFAYLFGIRGKLARWALIRRARAGEPPRDGEKVAAIGRLVPNGGALVSPFSKSAAVAYKYEIRVDRSKSDALLYSGFALTPSVIQGPQGGIRLLAYPELRVRPQSRSDDEAQRNAAEYIKTAKFRESGFANLRQAWSEMIALYSDDDGNVRDDHRSTSDPDLTGARFVEWIVRPGEPVCVVGDYSSQKGGIVPDPKMPLEQVTVESGEPDVFAGRAMRGAIGHLIGGVIVLGAAAAALAGFLAYVPLDASEQMAPEMNPSWPEIRLERLIERRVRVPMRQAGMLDSGSVITNMLSSGSAHGRVKGGSRDEVVSSASAKRENGQTTITIDEGVMVLTLDDRSRPVRLRLLGREIPPDAFPTALDFELSENTDETVGGRLTFLSDRPDLPACRVAFRAR